jgi:hypothetical protein
LWKTIKTLLFHASETQWKIPCLWDFTQITYNNSTDKKVLFFLSKHKICTVIGQ